MVKYTIEGKNYLILPPKRNRIGVFKENDLIFHQLRPNQVRNEDKSVFIGNNIKEEAEQAKEWEDGGFASEKWFGKWAARLVRSLMCCRGANVEVLFLETFVLTLNEYCFPRRPKDCDVKHLTLEYTPAQSYHIKQIGVPAPYTNEQYKAWIAPTLEGKVDHLSSHEDFYGYYSDFSYNTLYKKYRPKFELYLKERELV